MGNDLIQRRVSFPMLHEVQEVFPQVSSKDYVEATRIKAAALVEMTNLQEHSNVTQTSVTSLASVANTAITANPHLRGVELN